MSNISLIIEERAASIGSFMVGRLLTFRQKRAVGPFVFIDHMGPVKLSARQQMEVLPHPHIGLSTLTYLFEGAIMHRDSIGSVMEIEPGAVNWMTAGKGVVHSERTPERLQDSEKHLHGLQIWVALPKDSEEMEPSFVHVPAEEIPSWQENGAQFKLIAGAAFGRKSPVPVHSNLYFIEIKSKEAQTINIGEHLFGESALYILEGAIESEGHVFGPKQILIAENSTLCSFEMQANTTVYIFGGDVSPEERFIDWNFVSSSKERLKQAKVDWIAQRFPKIEGETDFVPYPERKI
jgi:redox-sensitive bicupin YhaK (pirin superfamily)